MIRIALGLALLGTALRAPCQPADSTAPRLTSRDGRFALTVDGRPFLMLGAQINNSSSWPVSLPQVWPALEALHVNTGK